MTADPLREHLSRALAWGDAHVTFEAAVDGVPVALRAVRPPGLPYSPWELLEHLRLAQHDILDFCVNPAYRELRWPEDYWPGSGPGDGAWEQSIDAFRGDREALQRLAAEQSDLLAAIPHGSGQTYLRELLLVVDHNAYHIGQLIAVRRALGIWADA